MSTVLPTRADVSPPRPLSSGVDALLRVAAGSTSGLALIVLAGIPPAGSTAVDAVRVLALLSFWLVAPGAVIVTRLRIPTLTKVATTPLIGLSLLIGIATVGSWTSLWVPRASAALVALATLTAASTDVSSGRLRLRTFRSPLALTFRTPPPRLVTVVLLSGLLAAVGLWWASLSAISSSRPSIFGLLAVAPWTFPSAILLTSVVLLVGLRRGNAPVTATAVLTLVLVMRSTASVVSPVPTAAWTYKHLGVVRTLQENHLVTAGGDIYMNWPGMFAASAYLSDSSGVEIIDVARWIAPLVHVLIALGTAALARALGAGSVGAAAAAAIIVVFNWMGQDYFAPQAVAMCLATGIIALLVQSSTTRACAFLALGLFPALVVTHQLTPFWVLALTIILVLLGRVPWLLAGGMSLVLLLYLASRLEVAQAYGLLSGFDPVGNAASNVPPVPAQGREIGGLLSMTSSLLMWGSTLVVLAARSLRQGWRRGWRSPDVLVPAAIAFSPFLLLAGQDYGGEARLRVALYSALGCCTVLGPALATALTRRAPLALAAAMWALVAVGASTGASYTLWSVNLIQPEDVAAARWLAEEHPNSLVIPIINIWPGRTSVDYDRFVGPRAKPTEPGLDDLLAMSGEHDPSSSTPLSADIVAEVVQRRPRTHTFVVFTGTMRQYDAYYATYSPGDYEETLQQLTASPNWELVRHEDDLWILWSRGPGTPDA